MRQAVLGMVLLLAAGSMISAQEPPRVPGRNVVVDEAVAKAVLQIKSEAGLCFWTISGEGDLVRLPVEDQRFSAILLSAHFEGEELRLTMAGEKAPLETISLGQYDLPLREGTPVTVTGARSAKSRSDQWELQVVPRQKVDTSNCCTCGIYKLSCCPNANYCIGCGVCGTCCG